MKLQLIFLLMDLLMLIAIPAVYLLGKCGIIRKRDQHEV